MNRVYCGQSALRITAKTFCNLEDVQAAAIRYRKPGGEVGEFAAAVSDEEGGVIFHECIEGEIDAAGWWDLWAFITFEDGRTAAGERARMFVWREGKG
jgi:hypothetical protein